jgi:hypothetical protein
MTQQKQDLLVALALALACGTISYFAATRAADPTGAFVWFGLLSLVSGIASVAGFFAFAAGLFEH